MNAELDNQIKNVVDYWSFDLNAIRNRKDIIAVSFGVQKVFDGYELCLFGHSWYDENGLWYLAEDWFPSKNYIQN
jgi:hypothetical protein